MGAALVTSADRERGAAAPPFRVLLSAGFTSLTGDGVRAAALPLFTAVTTHSPLAVSAVATAEVLPWLLVAVPAGALVDRCSPRLVVLAAHAARAAVAGGLAAAAFAGAATLPVLVAAAFLLTCGETFADSAFQTLLVRLSGREHLDRANGWYVTAETIGLDLAGPLLAAALFGWQPGACFAVNAACFAVTAGLVSALPRVPPSAEPGSRAGSLRAGLVEGGRFLLRERGLRTLVFAVVAAALAVSAANALASLYAIGPLHLRPSLVPTLWVAQAVGTLLVARLVPPLVARFGDVRIMIPALLLLGCSFVLLGAVPVAPVAWVAYFLVGVGMGGWNVLSATRRQRLTPNALMGRVTSVYRTLAWGLMPVGAALAGPFAAATSLAAVFVTVGVVVAAVAIGVARPLARTHP